MPPKQPPKKTPQRPRKTASSKPKGNSRVTTYVRKDGTKVKGHVRENPGWTRAKKTWAGAGFSGLTCVGILFEAGFTLLSTTAVLLIAILTTAAVWGGTIAEANKKKMGGTSRARRATRPRRPSSGGRRTTGRR